MQRALTPVLALKLLKEGNERFTSNKRLNLNCKEQVEKTSDRQYPFAVILSCMDSRTPSELIFDQGIGDVFSIRIAGNICNSDILGSMEFGCKTAGAKIILVLGHTQCGAIKGACDRIEMGSFTGLLSKIRPAVEEEIATKENRSSNNTQFVDNVAAINVRRTVQAITEHSSILQKMIEQGDIGIVGGIYDVSSGFVSFFSDTKSSALLSTQQFASGTNPKR